MAKAWAVRKTENRDKNISLLQRSPQVCYSIPVVNTKHTDI